MLSLAIPIPGWDKTSYFFAAPTQDQAKKIAWDDLKALVPKQWLDGRPNESELVIRTNVHGIRSELWIAGLDKPERIEGKPWHGGVMDEVADTKPRAFPISIYPALSDTQGWCWLIGVPKRNGRSAKEYKDLFDKGILGDDPEWASFTWKRKSFATDEVIAAAQRTLDPKDYREQFEASFETAGGGIYDCFSKEYNVRPCSYVKDKPIIVCSDFNVDPMAWVLCHDYKGRVEIFDELFIRDTNTRKTLDILFGRYGDHKGGFEFYGDPAGKQRKTSATQSDYDLILSDERFKKMGRTVHYMAAHPACSDRYAAMNAMLLNAAGDRRLFVDPHCEHIINDLEGCYYEPGTREASASGDLTHASDALGYFIYYRYPIKPIESVVGGRFGV